MIIAEHSQLFRTCKILKINQKLFYGKLSITYLLTSLSIWYIISRSDEFLVLIYAEGVQVYQNFSAPGHFYISTPRSSGFKSPLQRSRHPHSAWHSEVYLRRRLHETHVDSTRTTRQALKLPIVFTWDDFITTIPCWGFNSVFITGWNAFDVTKLHKKKIWLMTR